MHTHAHTMDVESVTSRWRPPRMHSPVKMNARTWIGWGRTSMHKNSLSRFPLFTPFHFLCFDIFASSSTLHLVLSCSQVMENITWPENQQHHIMYIDKPRIFHVTRYTSPNALWYVHILLSFARKFSKFYAIGVFTDLCIQVYALLKD